MEEKYINFPINGKSQQVKVPHSVVIVGANGSGKSHLGAWIEDVKNNKDVLRISAQRALSIPETLHIISGESAWNRIYCGSETKQDKGHKWQWSKHTSTLINDFECVLSKVFSDENSQLRKHKDDEDKSGAYIKVETIVERIYKIWNSILPQRQIILDDYAAKAKYGDEEYKAGEMSDGERVCLYLIAQCLITPDNHSIVIDEPEIHLHTSIMKKLWDEIERQCPNKTFIYITHDLKFASSRETALKVWVKSYDGKGNWDLSFIEHNEEIPESLLLEILGTRKPILFVEGTKDSYDVALYKEIYEDYHVVPCDNCHKVIELTKAFNNGNVRNLHDYDVKGLIDHDFLTEEEIKGYQKDNIYTINVSEVENLFLIEPLIKLAAKQIGDDADKAFSTVADFLFNEMENNKSKIINAICNKEIRHRLNGFYSKGTNAQELQKDLETMVSNIGVNETVTKVETQISNIINNRDYKALILLYNNKGLCAQVGGKLGYKKTYRNIILDLLQGEKRPEIVTALKGYLPVITQNSANM